MTNLLNIIVDDFGIWYLGYRYKVVYIFHKGIISYVLSCYEVQMNMLLLFFEWKSIFSENFGILPGMDCLLIMYFLIIPPWEVSQS